MSSHRPDAEGVLHYHNCPECYKRAPCWMECTIEPDLSQERPTGHHSRCDDCATPEDVLAWRGLTDDDVSEAIEVLYAHGWWPWQPGDPDSPRWWCERCDETHTFVGWTPCECCGDGSCPCSWSGEDAIPAQPTIAALLAVVSMGVGRIVRAVALAREIAHHKGYVNAVVMWRVMDRESLAEHHKQSSARAIDALARGWPDLAGRFSIETVTMTRGALAWPKTLYLRGDWEPGYQPTRSLAIDERGVATGFHLLAADEERIVLGVEANDD